MEDMDSMNEEELRAALSAKDEMVKQLEDKIAELMADSEAQMTSEETAQADAPAVVEQAEEVEEEGGWIVGLNFRDHVADEVARARLGRYIWSGPRFRAMSWRAQDPLTLCQAVEVMVQKRLGM